MKYCPHCKMNVTSDKDVSKFWSIALFPTYQIWRKFFKKENKCPHCGKKDLASYQVDAVNEDELKPGFKSKDVRRRAQEWNIRTEDKFVEKFKKERKSIFKARLLCIFGVILGLHYTYLKQWWKNFFFFITLGGVFLWWFRDIFYVSRLVEEENNKIAAKVAKEIGSELPDGG